MKVKNFIEKLKTLDPESLIVVRGLDEAGYADIHTVETIQVQRRKSEGAIAALGEYETLVSKGESLSAVLIDHS